MPFWLSGGGTKITACRSMGDAPTLLGRRGTGLDPAPPASLSAISRSPATRLLTRTWLFALTHTAEYLQRG